MNKLIIIAGIPAAGKTTLGTYIAEKLMLPLVSRDSIKSRIWDSIRFETSDKKASSMYGNLSHDIFWLMCETIMKSCTPLIIENTFTMQTLQTLNTLITAYEYEVLTILLDTDLKIAYNRFQERERSDRHAGLFVSGINYNDFEQSSIPCRNFRMGEMLHINTKDFTKVFYKDILDDVKNFIYKGENI